LVHRASFNAVLEFKAYASPTKEESGGNHLIYRMIWALFAGVRNNMLTRNATVEVAKRTNFQQPTRGFSRD
jgi:hypothetical protein